MLKACRRLKESSPLRVYIIQLLDGLELELEGSPRSDENGNDTSHDIIKTAIVTEDGKKAVSLA